MRVDEDLLGVDCASRLSLVNEASLLSTCYKVLLSACLTCNIAYCTKYQDEDQGKSELAPTAGQSVELTFDVASVLFMLDLYPSSSYNLKEKEKKKFELLVVLTETSD